MQAGNLDRKVIIQQETRTQNADTGELVRSYSTLATTFASVAPLRMREVIINNETDKSNRTLAIERYYFTVRYFSGLNEKCRISLDGRIFNIKGYQEVGRKHWWKIDAECVGETS